MKAAKLSVAICLCVLCRVAASGATGVVAVIEKVVFEPDGSDAATAERMQLWGAFSFMEGGIAANGATSTPARGYLYFALPAAGAEQIKVVRNEWSDLKAVAGTGDGVAFGQWMYVGAFGSGGPTSVYVTIQVGERMYRSVPLVVLTQAPPAVEATPYVTNTGLVKLSSDGSHAAIVRKLKDALAR
jgi:hypothetical protein